VPLAEQTSKDYEPMIRRLRDAVGSHLEEHVRWTPYIANNLHAADGPPLPRIMPQLLASGPPARQESGIVVREGDAADAVENAGEGGTQNVA
jgi:hypothetical protein